MPVALARYDDLLHHDYASGLEPARWPATLGAIAEVFDARSVALWSFMHGADQGGICFTTGSTNPGSRRSRPSARRKTRSRRR